MGKGCPGAAIAETCYVRPGKWSIFLFW